MLHPTLTPAERERYARHLLLPHVGPEGQRALKEARVLLVGAGGLGSPAGLYLAAAGVGTLGIVDDDAVDLSNLQRQVLHGTGDLGRPKVASAADRIREVNPHVEVEPHELRLDSSNALALFERYDVILDGTDNFATRYLVNDAGVLTGKPVVHGAIFRWEGQATVFRTPDGPCYRCLFPTPPEPGTVPSCAEGGVLGVLPGIVGSIQAAETIKLVLGTGEPLVGRLLLFDALRMGFRELKLRRDPDCPVCGESPEIHELMDYDVFCGTSTTEIDESMADETREITATELKERLDRGERITLLDVREQNEWEIGNLGEHGAQLMPLGDLPDRYDELDADRDMVVYCRSGARSDRAIKFLEQHGFSRLRNLKGGILAWSDEVDPAMPKY